MRIAILLVALAAAGCQTTALKTPSSISIANVNEFTLQDAANTAQAHCQQYGKDAEFMPDDKADGMAHFRCT